MRKLILAGAFALTSNLYLQAQLTPTFIDSTALIRIGASGQFQSTAVPHEFLHPFLFGGFIEEEMKNNAAQYLKSKNNLSLEFGGGLAFNSGIKKELLGIKNAFWGVELGTQFLSFSTYTQDLFNLTFYGNNPYVGQTLDFAGSRTNTLWFHRITLVGGVQTSNFGPFDRLELTLKPSFYLGSYNLQASLDRANLLTEENGEYIDVDFQASYNITDTALNAGKIEGYGGGLDFDLKTQLGKTLITLSVNNLGVISFKDQYNYQIDSAFTFSGYAIEDVFNIQDTLIDVASLEDSILVAQEESNTLFLPFRVGLYVELPLADQIFWGTLAQYRLAPNYLPFVQTRVKYEATDELFYAALSAAYGGYGGFQAGLHLGVKVQGISLELGTSNYLGFFSIKTQRSQGVYAQLGYRF